MNSSEFQKLIKSKQLSGAYLLHGEEELFKDRAVKEIITAAIPDGLESMNVQTLEESVSIDELINAVQTLPFLAPKRVVICRNFSALMLDKRQLNSQNTKDVVKRVEEIIDHLQDSCMLLFLHRGAVGKDQPLYKALKKRKQDISFSEPKAADKRAILKSLASEMGLKISAGDISFLIDYTEANLITLQQELHKLQSSSGGGPVTRQHIMSICTPSMHYNVFTMIRAITRNEAGQALSILRDMLDDNENPGGILLLLERQFRTLIYIDDIKDKYRDRNIDFKELEKKLNVKDFVIKNMMRWEHRYSPAERKAVIRWCADADYFHKQGLQNDRAAIEALVMRLLHINNRK